MSFKYVLIPSDDSKPIQEFHGDKSGGLSNDYLIRYAKEYFFEKNGGALRTSTLQNLSSEEQKLYADEIRKQYGTANSDNKLKQLDDETLVKIFSSSQNTPSAEIIALTVPTDLNHYEAVSLYGDDHARNLGLPFNTRATSVMLACGHTFPATSENTDGKPSGIYGDVFIGRCVDDEVRDIWERVDFTASEVEGCVEDKEWCRIARRKGGGGGYNSKPAASLSGMMNNMLSGSNIHEKSEGLYSWTQTDDEVELKFSLPSGTKAKYVKVKFSSKALKITATGQTLCDDDLFGGVKVDDCTYTVQDDADSSKGPELCVILTKKIEEQWSRVFNKTR